MPRHQSLANVKAFARLQAFAYLIIKMFCAIRFSENLNFAVISLISWLYDAVYLFYIKTF